MKITTTNTCLHFLEPGRFNPLAFRLSEDTTHMEIEKKRAFAFSLIDQFPAIIPFMKDNIRLITTPFHDAYMKAKHRLSTIFDQEPINESGVFIIQADASHWNTIFYYIKTESHKENWCYQTFIMLFGKDSKKDKPTLDYCILHKPDFESGKVSEKNYISEKGEEFGIEPMSIIADLVGILTFLKYCELETKIVAGGKREHHVGEKYVNETKQKIEILDSTWFTTIIRSEGFGVQGHFRMQPFGPGMSRRKLIWIAPFEKDGYTRTAKILNP